MHQGSASALCTCLAAFGGKEQQAHLALECFAQIRLRCLHKRQTALVEAGVPAAVGAAMQQHAHHGAVQTLGCEILGLLAGCTPSAARHVYKHYVQRAPPSPAKQVESERPSAEPVVELAC